MRKRSALSLALVALAGPELVAQSRPTLSPLTKQFVAEDAPVIAIRHVRVIDGTGAPARENQSVVLRNGIIVGAGDDAVVPVPADAKVIDGTGKTVIPGLVDLHGHTYFYSSAGLTEMDISGPRLYLAGGVTSIRTAGGQFPYNELNMKRDVDRGAAPGPRIDISGPYLDGPRAGPGLNRRLESPDEARRVVAYWAEEGATWLKFQGSVSRAVMGAAIDEAHRHGMRVTGHLCSVSFAEAAALGIDNLEHGFITNSEYVPGKKPDECPAENMRYQAEVDVESPQVDASIANLVAKKVPITSTLAVYELFVPGRAKVADGVLDALSPRAREATLADLTAVNGNQTFTVPPVLFGKMMRWERKFVAAGGLLAAGVDPWGNGSLPGYGDQRNFEVLVEAGFNPLEVVKIMTLNGAQVLGRADKIGSITVGKWADVVLLDGNPAARASDIRNVSLVFKDGVGYDPKKLLESVRGMVGIR